MVTWLHKKPSGGEKLKTCCFRTLSVAVFEIKLLSLGQKKQKQLSANQSVQVLIF